jgi:hypothetical protein
MFKLVIDGQATEALWAPLRSTVKREKHIANPAKSVMTNRIGAPREWRIGAKEMDFIRGQPEGFNTTTVAPESRFLVNGY